MTTKHLLERGESVKNWLEAAAILIAAPWAFYTFYFENVIIPEKEPPYLVISSQHNIDGQKGKYWIVRSQVKIKNYSKMRTTILGASFNVIAYEADVSDFYDTAYAGQIKSSASGSPTFPRFYQGKSITVNVGRLIEEHWTIDPGEEFSRSFVSLVPKKGYDIVRFYADLYACRETKDSLKVEWQVDSSGIVDLQPHLGRRKLEAETDKVLIKKDGLQRFVDLEEFSCTTHKTEMPN